MALILNQLAIRRVTAPEGEFSGTWWDVRLDLPWGYAGSIQAAMADAKGEGLMAASSLLIRALVKDWNVELEPGKVAPITDEVIAQLPMKFVTYMVTDDKAGLMTFLALPSAPQKAS
jgi:hypothetical protein